MASTAADAAAVAAAAPATAAVPGGRTGAVALKRARAATAAGEGVLPRKADFRQRAHINPLSHQLYEYPVAPARAQWPRHYPAFACPARPGAALARRAAVRAVDVGCGFGGLTLALAEALPSDDLVLGMEIRSKVTEYVRLRLQAMRMGGAAAAAAAAAAEGEAEGAEGAAAAAAAAAAAPAPAPAPPRPPSHHNASVLKTNAMKYLPCYFPRGSLTHLFFCFADPQFKPTNHRRRIVNAQLLAEYAHVLRVGGRLYAITDVPDLFNWTVAHAAAHPCFARLPPEQADADPAVRLMRERTEESQKVAREGRSGAVQWGVWVRLGEAEALARERELTRGDWWAEPQVDYTWIPSAGSLSKGSSKDWRAVISQQVAEAAGGAAAAAGAAAAGGEGGSQTKGSPSD